MTDTGAAESAAPAGSTRGDVGRLILVLVVLVALAFVLIAASHLGQPTCGGG